MPKKRKSEAAGLEEVERSLFSTFCSAANSISQLYTLAHNQQRAGFLAGERHALVRLQQWLEAGAQPGVQGGSGSYISREKLLDYLQGELDRLDEGWPAHMHNQGGAHGPGSAVVAPGGTAAGAGIPPSNRSNVDAPAAGRQGFGPGGMAASHLLSQLHQCHIRPRPGPGDGVIPSGAATPSGSSCWDSSTDVRQGRDSGAVSELRLPPACAENLPRPIATHGPAGPVQGTCAPCLTNAVSHGGVQGGQLRTVLGSEQVDSSYSRVNPVAAAGFHRTGGQCQQPAPTGATGLCQGRAGVSNFGPMLDPDLRVAQARMCVTARDGHVEQACTIPDVGLPSLEPPAGAEGSPLGQSLFSPFSFHDAGQPCEGSDSQMS